MPAAPPRARRCPPAGLHQSGWWAGEEDRPPTGTTAATHGLHHTATSRRAVARIIDVCSQCGTALDASAHSQHLSRPVFTSDKEVMFSPVSLRQSVCLRITQKLPIRSLRNFTQSLDIICRDQLVRFCWYSGSGSGFRNFWKEFYHCVIDSGKGSSSLIRNNRKKCRLRTSD